MGTIVTIDENCLGLLAYGWRCSGNSRWAYARSSYPLYSMEGMLMMTRSLSGADRRRTVPIRMRKKGGQVHLHRSTMRSMSLQSKRNLTARKGGRRLGVKNGWDYPRPRCSAQNVAVAI